jgi:hypothetical protein
MMMEKIEIKNERKKSNQKDTVVQKAIWMGNYKVPACFQEVRRTVRQVLDCASFF